MLPNCPTPPLKKYIDLKGLPNKTFLRSKIDESGAQGVLFDEKNRESKIL
jgi:hypothetical protein